MKCWYNIIVSHISLKSSCPDEYRSISMEQAANMK